MSCGHVRPNVLFADPSADNPMQYLQFRRTITGRHLLRGLNCHL